MKQWIAIGLLCTGCMNGTETLQIPNSTQHILSDGSTNINVNFTFIQQLIMLCQQDILPESYATTELYNQAVAQCVLNSASALNPSNSPLCQPNADLSGFTLEQIQTITATCSALGA